MKSHCRGFPLVRITQTFRRTSKSDDIVVFAALVFPGRLRNFDKRYGSKAINDGSKNKSDRFFAPKRPPQINNSHL